MSCTSAHCAPSVYIGPTAHLNVPASLRFKDHHKPSNPNMGLAQSSAIPTNPSPQLAAALRWLGALAEGKIELLEAVTTDGCVEMTSPASLGVEPSHGKSAILTKYAMIFPLFTSFEATVHEVTETPEKVILHVSGDAYIVSGYHYVQEYIYSFNVFEQADGTYKVSKVHEFADSAAYTGHLQAFADLSRSASS